MGAERREERREGGRESRSVLHSERLGESSHVKQLQLVQDQAVRGGAAAGGATDMKGWAKSGGLKLAGKHGKMESLLYKVEESAAAGGGGGG